MCDQNLFYVVTTWFAHITSFQTLFFLNDLCWCCISSHFFYVLVWCVRIKVMGWNKGFCWLMLTLTAAHGLLCSTTHWLKWTMVNTFIGVTVPLIDNLVFIKSHWGVGVSGLRNAHVLFWGTATNQTCLCHLCLSWLMPKLDVPTWRCLICVGNVFDV